eukprot:20362-Heterococcus_DN1.PRE.3
MVCERCCFYDAFTWLQRFKLYAVYCYICVAMLSIDRVFVARAASAVAAAAAAAAAFKVAACCYS